MKRVTVFDFDGTLVNGDTFLMFARHVRGRRGTYCALMRAMPWIVAWKLGLQDNSKAKEKLFGELYRGMPKAHFQAHAETFADVVDGKLRRQGMEALRQCQERGDECIIDTASVDTWVRPWAMRHGFADVIGTMAETDENGLLTGRFASPNCYGPEKVSRLRDKYPDRSAMHVTAYGDSSGDRELLDYADEPFLLKHRSRRDIRIFWIFLGVVTVLMLSILLTWNRYITSPPHVSETRFPVRGIDVSSYQGMMNLDAVAEAGYEFIFIKASEGTDYRDPNFALNYMKAGHAGLKRGAYHFFRFDKDGVEQALNLLRIVGPRPLELGVAIDVEDHGNPAGIPADSIAMRLRDMVDFLNLKGCRPTFYSNEQGFEKYIYPAYRGMPLWLCSFNENTANRDWTYWQYNHRGRVPGVRGDVDLNAFGGDREQWKEHLRQYAK